MPTPFKAFLFNEADEIHKEVSLDICHEKIVVDGITYRLVEASRDGAAYKFLGYAGDGATSTTLAN